MSHSDWSYSKKHHVIMHRTHPLTRLIIKTEHICLMNAGPTLQISAELRPELCRYRLLSDSSRRLELTMQAPSKQNMNTWRSQLSWRYVWQWKQFILNWCEIWWPNLLLQHCVDSQLNMASQHSSGMIMEPALLAPIVSWKNWMLSSVIKALKVQFSISALLFRLYTENTLQ